MRTLLVSLDGGPQIAFRGVSALVGRSSRCDIWIDSPLVSRRHCLLVADGGRLAVCDLGSRNGIRVNGLRVADAMLGPGDELGIGRLRYRVEEVAGRAGVGPVGPVGPGKPVGPGGRGNPPA